MSLHNQLKQEAMIALKNKDFKKSQALRYLISLIDKRGLQLPPDGLSEAEVLTVLQKEMKNKQESKDIFLKAGRQELVDEVDYEINLLSTYLPATASEAEIKASTLEIMGSVGKNFGLVMKEVMVKFKGKADGSVVSKVVREVIEQA